MLQFEQDMFTCLGWNEDLWTSTTTFQEMQIDNAEPNSKYLEYTTHEYEAMFDCAFGVTEKEDKWCSGADSAVRHSSLEACLAACYASLACAVCYDYGGLHRNICT